MYMCLVDVDPLSHLNAGNPLIFTTLLITADYCKDVICLEVSLVYYNVTPHKAKNHFNNMYAIKMVTL